MINFYINSSVYVQVLVATFLTWGITALGASIVFFFKKVNGNVLDAMLGLSAGVMISASFWSLLNPAINQADALGMNSWLIVSIGFFTGGLVLILGDILFEKILTKKKRKNSYSMKRSLMLIFSITLHNIPEGLAIGVAFGSIALGVDGATLASAFMLAVGVGIQNFPEGTSVSLPLRREKFSRKKAFIYGALSGIVEPIAGLVGCILVIYVQNILPFFLAFAAGAMIYVAMSELIPESQKNPHKNLMSLFTILGFVIMMMLDVALG
ncbi:MAG: ZIP family metal transporter [Firmicutes bacterium]|nr:ZIP family metal transporter [Bacillota bacterium]